MIKAETALLIGGVLVGLYLWKQAGKLAGAVGDLASSAVPYINPAADTNIAYQAAGKITQTMTGDQDASLGTWIYDVTH